MKVDFLQAGMLGTNCYFLKNEDTKELLVVDPGGDGKWLAEKIKEDGFVCKGILLTHGHYDHVEGVNDLVDELGAVKVYALDKEKETLDDPKINMSSDIVRNGKSYYADEYFCDGQEVNLAGIDFKVIATPGHTLGGCCFYFESDGILISGDTLFNGSVGRSDFPGGNMDELTKSIKEKLYTLPDETKVLPGHMSPTTIGKEKTSNMFVR